MNRIISHTNVGGFKPNRAIQSFVKPLDTYSAQGRSHISHLQPTFLSLDLFLSSERRNKCSSTDSHVCYRKIYQYGTPPGCKTSIVSQHLKSVIVKCTSRHHFWLSCGLATDLEPSSKGQECTCNYNEIS